jgi:hypothetical protein
MRHTDEEMAATLAGCLNHFVGIGECGGDGLFEKHMFAGGERIESDLAVQMRR